MNKNVRGWVLVFVIFVVVPAVGLTWLWKDRCVVESVSTVASPDGGWAVRVDHKDCGPAMKVATEVYVGGADGGASGGGDLVMLLHGPHAVDVQWTAAQAVTLRPPAGATIVSRRLTAGPVAVTVDQPQPQ